MRYIFYILVIAEIVFLGAAYSRNPKGCQKLYADLLQIYNTPPTSDSPIARVEQNATNSDTPPQEIQNLNPASTPAAPTPALPTPDTATAPQPAPVAPNIKTFVATPVAESPEQIQQDISNQFDMRTVTYNDALAQAKAQNKKILLDFTGSDWCPYCQDLDREVINSRTFQNYAVGKFVFVVVDFPQNTQLAQDIREQNDMLKAKYGINGYPTLIVTDSSGSEIGRTSGYDPGTGAQGVISELDRFTR